MLFDFRCKGAASSTGKETLTLFEADNTKEVTDRATEILHALTVAQIKVVVVWASLRASGWCSGLKQSNLLTCRTWKLMSPIIRFTVTSTKERMTSCPNERVIAQVCECHYNPRAFCFVHHQAEDILPTPLLMLNLTRMCHKMFKGHYTGKV